MPRYSSSDTIYPEDAPYQPSRSAMRRRFGNRAIVSKGAADSGRPGSASARDPETGLTEEATWRDAFASKSQKAAAATATPINYLGQPITGTNYSGESVTLGGTPTADPARPMAAPVSDPTWYNARGGMLREGRPEGALPGGTNFVSRFGTGSVRSATDVRLGRNEPRDPKTMTAWDAYLKSPAAAAPPPTSMSLLPSPRQGTSTVPQRTSDFSPTPTADDYYGAILSKPFSITTGVLDRLAGPSPWEEPI